MDDDGVSTDSSDNFGGGGESSHRPHLLTWAELAEKECPYYMAMGMTADEYWNGDHSMLKFYRQAFEVKRQQQDYEAWLNGLYIYGALCSVAPVLRAFSKAKRPEPYLKQPLSYDKVAEKSETHRQSNDNKAKDLMSAWAVSFNQRFKQKEQPTQKD